MTNRGRGGTGPAGLCTERAPRGMEHWPSVSTAQRATSARFGPLGKAAQLDRTYTTAGSGTLRCEVEVSEFEQIVSLGGRISLARVSWIFAGSRRHHGYAVGAAKRDDRVNNALTAKRPRN